MDSDVRLLLPRRGSGAVRGSILRAKRLVEAHVGPLPDGFNSAEGRPAALQGMFQGEGIRVGG